MDVDGYERGLNVITTYDDLLQEYVLINQSIKDDEIDKKHAEYIRSVFIDNKRNQILDEAVEKDIEDLVATLTDEFAVVQATARELNEYIGASYLNLLNSVVTSQKINIKLYIALALVFFLFFGCAGAVVIGRLKDFLQYILYTDKTTKLPNRPMCDVQINALSEKELGEQFTCLIIRLDNLQELNDTLGRSAGDALLGSFGEILKTLSRNYGFMGCSTGGTFLGLFEQCSVSKAKLFLEMLDKSVNEFNEEQIELHARYSAAFSNSTEDKIYAVRALIRNTFKRMP